MILFGVVLSVVLVVSGIVLSCMSRQLSLGSAQQTPLSIDGPVESYEPMLRLLSQGDLSLLRRHAAYSSDMESKFRAERCRIFRVYLRSLRGEFRQTCTALKLVMLQSQVDRPDLASLLLRSQVNFGYRLAIIQVNVAFYRFGIGTVDCAELLAPFRGIRTALELLTPIAEPMAS
jgi:hypothetical protein